MSFASDYTTAYRLLREGRADPKLFDKAVNRRHGSTYEDWRAAREAFENVRRDVFGRVRAAIYAFKLAKEMRRQKTLAHFVLGLKEQDEQAEVRGEKKYVLFPITINRTTMNVRDPDKGPQ